MTIQDDNQNPDLSVGVQYTRAELAGVIDRAHDELHIAAEQDRMSPGYREPGQLLALIHDILHVGGAGLERIGCATRDPEAQSVVAELRAKLNQPLPTCNHLLEDLIGGKDAVTTCGACLAERQAKRKAEAANGATNPTKDETIAEFTHQRAALGEAIAELAKKAGIYNGAAGVTGPHLIGFCGDIATELERLRLIETAAKKWADSESTSDKLSQAEMELLLALQGLTMDSKLDEKQVDALLAGSEASSALASNQRAARVVGESLIKKPSGQPFRIVGTEAAETLLAKLLRRSAPGFVIAYSDEEARALAERTTDWKASLGPKQWEIGGTVYEAIGQLVGAFEEELGVLIGWPEEEKPVAPGHETPILFRRPGGSCLKIDAAAAAVMRSHAQHADDALEAGGVLIGRLIVGSGAFVVDNVSSPMPEDVRSRHGITRTAAPHQRELDAAWEASGGTQNYLGEWHTHPEPDPVQSTVDLADWKKRLAEDGRGIDHIFFLIVGQKVIRAWMGLRSTGEIVLLDAVSGAGELR